MMLAVPHVACLQERPKPLWQITKPGPGDYAAVWFDTSISNLRSIITQQRSFSLFAAARLLAIIDGENQRDFILQHITTPVPTTRTGNWGSYFSYHVIRGYLGEEEKAIEGMETIVNFFGSTDDYSMMAIFRLAEAGRLEYFETVQEAFYTNNLKEDAVIALGIYGQDQRYRDQARYLLVQALSETEDDLIIDHAAQSLAKFDEPTLVNTLHDRFNSSNGELKWKMFFELSNYDPEGQPERLMEAVPSEPDENIRSDYFPIYTSIVKGKASKRYLQPFFIKFVLDWLEQEPSSLVSKHVKTVFYDAYIPLPPPDTVTIDAMLGNLIGITAEASNYNWIGTFENFVTELDVHLDAAQVAISAQDWPWAISELSSFRDKVQGAYDDPQETRFTTIDGYKFLYYNAQYIIDRIEEQI